MKNSGRPRHDRFTPLEISRLEKHIDARLSEPLTLITLAESFAISRTHFARLLKAATGKTTCAFVAERRVRAAARILEKRGNLSFAEIALRCGFYDQSHMTRHFNRVLGVTPKAFLDEPKTNPEQERNFR